MADSVNAMIEPDMNPSDVQPLDSSEIFYHPSLNLFEEDERAIIQESVVVTIDRLQSESEHKNEDKSGLDNAPGEKLTSMFQTQERLFSGAELTQSDIQNIHRCVETQYEGVQFLEENGHRAAAHLLRAKTRIIQGKIYSQIRFAPN